MKKTIKFFGASILAHKSQIAKIFLFLLVFLFTFILRASGYERVPEYGHLEELQYGWAGINLVETGSPVSWNPNPREIEKKNIIYSGPISDEGKQTTVHVTLVKPFLEEPPLFSLLVGYTSHLFGADRTKIISPAYLRFPMIFIAAATSILIFFLGRKLFGYWIGLLAMLFFGTIPIFLFSSRFAIPENLIAFFYILSILLVVYFLEKPRIWLFLPLLFLPGLAGLAKPTGFLIAPFVSFLLLKKDFWRHAIVILLALLPFIAIFLIYGFHFDAKLFGEVLRTQGTRPVGWSALTFILATPAFDIKWFFDGWYMFFLLAALFFLIQPAQDKNIKLLAFACLYWILVVIFSGGEQDLLPWYRFPMFPFLAILGVLLIREFFQKPDFFRTSILVGFFFSARYYLSNPFRPNVTPNMFRFYFLLLVLPSLAYLVWKKKWLLWLMQAIIIFVLVAGTFLNSKLIYSYFPISCESLKCPIGVSTTLGRLYFPILWRILGP